MTADAIVREMEMPRSFRPEDFTPVSVSRPNDHPSEVAATTRFDGGDGGALASSQTHEHHQERTDATREEPRTYEDRPTPDYERRHDTERKEASGEYAAPRQEEETPPSRRSPEYEREQVLEKQSTLYDLNQLEARGVRLSRKWSMDDSLEDMTHELRHHLLVLDERENVGMMKNGMKMALTGIEIINTRFNLLDLEGWSTQAASELDRQDGNLSRIYRKYWRRSTSNNPESEILFSLFSSMGMYHMKRSMARQMMNRNTRPATRTRRRTTRVDDDSSDEERSPN